MAGSLALAVAADALVAALAVGLGALAAAAAAVGGGGNQLLDDAWKAVSQTMNTNAKEKVPYETL